MGVYPRSNTQPGNHFFSLIPNQTVVTIPELTLENGTTLLNVPVAYTTLGRLNAQADNCLVICHALTGSADVSDWWGPLVGATGTKAFDTSKFFVVCLNSLGSPYGTASPVTFIDGDEKLGRYGPEFPLTTVRDDVHLHKLVLDDLGVKQIASVVGGSMGGMLALEWAFCYPDFVRTVVAIATCARHSAWGISWGEAQRQSIYADPKYEDGYYSFEDPPSSGLGAARMAALLTYRSRDSFESRFGRNIPDVGRRRPNSTTQKQGQNGGAESAPSETLERLPTNEHWKVHNDGHRNDAPLTRNESFQARRNGSVSTPTQPVEQPALVDPQFHGTTDLAPSKTATELLASVTSQLPSINERGSESPKSPSATLPGNTPRLKPSTHFSAQSYLRYQGQKFVQRFDSNCYIAITRKLDTHDITRERASSTSEALATLTQPGLILGIQSDGLFTFAEQQEIADGMRDSRLKKIESPEGHDAFLLQVEQVNGYVRDFFHEVLGDVTGPERDVSAENGEEKKKEKRVESLVGAMEEGGDMTEW